MNNYTPNGTCPLCGAELEAIHFAGRLTDEYCSRWPAECTFWTHYEDAQAVLFPPAPQPVLAGFEAAL